MLLALIFWRDKCHNLFSSPVFIFQNKKHIKQVYKHIREFAFVSFIWKFKKKNTHQNKFMKAWLGLVPVRT